MEQIFLEVTPGVGHPTPMISRLMRLFTPISCITSLALLAGCAGGPSRSDARLADALTFHASFDHGLDADFAQGDRTLRHGGSLAKQSDSKPGLPATGEVRLESQAGRFGHALRFTQKKSPLTFFRADRNVPYSTSHWSGTVSFWLSTDPATELAPGFCDPIQLTPRAWNDACFFVEFEKRTNDVPFRLGVYPDSKVWNPSNKKWADVTAAEKPLSTAPTTPFRKGKWTHVVFTFERFNTGQADGVAKLYLDGDYAATVGPRQQTFTWNMEQCALALGLSYIGLFDELAVFNRALTAGEVRALHGLKNGVADLHRAPAPAKVTASTPAPATPVFTDVFVNGTEGYPAFRIPSLITAKDGTLLAFAEGRASLRDHAENDIVLKRSTDGGQTWSPLQVVAEDGTNALGNPTAAIVRETGRVLVMYQRYAKGFDEHKAEPGLDGPRICRTWLQHSDDHGATWSRPREITASVKRPTIVTSTATGPGIGIQLHRGPHAGRILMPFNQGPFGKWKVYAAYSDDRGETWHYGETADEGAAGHANEVQMAELSDGSVMLNARNQGGGLKQRKISISRDGGETWSTTQHDATLIEPVCQASLLRHPNTGDAARDVLIFSNPGTQTGRSNGVIRLSRDDGKTWPASRVLHPGGFAYSCLTSLPDGSVGCLFERDGYKTITFARFSVDWVEGR